MSELAISCHNFIKATNEVLAALDKIDRDVFAQMDEKTKDNLFKELNELDNKCEEMQNEIRIFNLWRDINNED